jgi:hypothetical protein
VWGNGSRPRQGKATNKVTGEGETHQYQACRFFCPQCQKSFTSLPADLLPDKHYVAAEIEDVVGHLLAGGKVSNAPSAADASTMRHWLKEFGQKLPQWAASLEDMIFQRSGLAPSLVRLLSNPLKRLEEALSRLPPLPSRCTVMVKTLWWLENSHPLCLPRPP